MTTYRITVRYGRRHHRYHTLEVEAPDVARALRDAADALPEEIVPDADLVELRIAAEPDEREYLGE